MSKRRSVELLTAGGCGLCRDIEPRLANWARLLRLPVSVVDIATAPELEADFYLRVPVVRDGDGRVLAEGEISAGRLIGAVLAARFLRPPAAPGGAG